MQENCIKLQAVKGIIEELEVREISPDYDPGDLEYDQILADVRHEYTNCDDLYRLIPDCSTCEEEEAGECVNVAIAHDEIKWAAKSAAEKIYLKWLEGAKTNESN